MTITNGYCTLAEFKDRFLQERTYTASTISFNDSPKTILDSANGLARFTAGTVAAPKLIQVTGSVANNTTFTVVTTTAGTLTVSETPTDGAAGPAVTITDISDVLDDASYENVIMAVSRWLDNITGTRFYANAIAEARYYTPDSEQRVYIDDNLGITELAVDNDGDGTCETVLTTSDYWAMPMNETRKTWLQVKPMGNYYFPTEYNAVRITGTWGYASTTPPLIKEICILESIKLFKRKDAPFGVMGQSELGQTLAQIKPDQTILDKLSIYMRDY
jgi:hypothetical protein